MNSTFNIIIYEFLALDDHVPNMSCAEIVLCYLRRSHEHTVGLYNARFYYLIMNRQTVRGNALGLSGNQFYFILLHDRLQDLSVLF